MERTDVQIGNCIIAEMVQIVKTYGSRGLEEAVAAFVLVPPAAEARNCPSVMRCTAYDVIRKGARGVLTQYFPVHTPLHDGRGSSRKIVHGWQLTLKRGSSLRM